MPLLIKKITMQRFYRIQYTQISVCGITRRGLRKLNEKVAAVLLT